VTDSGRGSVSCDSSSFNPDDLLGPSGTKRRR
jgi:hypothetical protein